MKTFNLDVTQFEAGGPDESVYKNRNDGLEAVGQLLSYAQGGEHVGMQVPPPGERSIKVPVACMDETPDRVIDELAGIAQKLFNRVGRGEGTIAALVEEHTKLLDEAFHAMPGPDEGEVATVE